MFPENCIFHSFSDIAILRNTKDYIGKIIFAFLIPQISIQPKTDLIFGIYRKNDYGKVGFVFQKQRRGPYICLGANPENEIGKFLYKFLIFIYGVCNNFFCNLFRKCFLSYRRETQEYESSLADAGCSYFSEGPLKRGPSQAQLRQNS